MHQNENDAPVLLDSTEAPRIAETLNLRERKGYAEARRVYRSLPAVHAQSSALMMICFVSG